MNVIFLSKWMYSLYTNGEKEWKKRERNYYITGIGKSEEKAWALEGEKIEEEKGNDVMLQINREGLKTLLSYPI